MGVWRGCGGVGHVVGQGGRAWGGEGGQSPCSTSGTGRALAGTLAHITLPCSLAVQCCAVPALALGKPASTLNCACGRCQGKGVGPGPLTTKPGGWCGGVSLSLAHWQSKMHASLWSGKARGHGSTRTGSTRCGAWCVGWKSSSVTVVPHGRSGSGSGKHRDLELAGWELPVVGNFTIKS